MYIHEDFAKNQENKEVQEQISVNDKIIKRIIDQNQAVSEYDDVIENNDHWQVFYHLSALRTSVLNWYEFPPDASVLEIGAGFGALTGMLCRTCAHVTATERSFFRAKALAKRYDNCDNLDIYVGDILDMSFEKQFDYIILIGILEKQGAGSLNQVGYIQYLKQLQKYLKPDGKMLIAVENRFGLKYFCGVPEPHTNRAFDGLNKYPAGTGGISFSRQELVDIVQDAGFEQYKFYYPLPDYKLPQLIYTDEYLPERNLRERLIPYYVRKDTLIANEMELYDDVIANGAFSFLANSFLVECTKCGNLGTVIYAAVSTDRGEERSFATTIHTGNVVKKKPLYSAGTQSARKLYDNMCDLQEHQIPIVPHKLNENGQITQPYIKHPTLSNAIKTIIHKDTKMYLDILDRIYQYILNSSEEAEGNALLERLLEVTDKEDERKKLKELDWGKVLKKAYMELIPLNCFYDQDKDELMFFDQEFVRENYPTGYVMFRAIHYIYAFTPGAEQSYPLASLKERYQLTDVWDYYLKEELRFLDVVRNHKRYSQFYKWAQIDVKRMHENALRLESEEETIANYKVSDKMKKIWKVELSILDEVDRICNKNNLTYYFVHGSLLGAVRHKGFIPWDDDLDIAMQRSDYDQFVEAAKRELREPFSIHTAATETDCFWGGYARIRNSLTTGIEMKELGHKTNLGIWIDILPLDYCTQDEKKFRKKQKSIRYYQRLLYAKIYGSEYKQFWDMTVWQWRAYRLWSRLFSHESLCRRLEHSMRLYTEDSEELSIFSSYDKHRRLSRKDFENVQYLEFEGRQIPAPIGYGNYLFAVMGRDYLKYPPESERMPKHKGIFDPEQSFETYVKLLSGLFDGAKGKKIILFGAGMMFEDYMGKYGDRYRPAFLVDNDQNKWGLYRMGIEICSPQKLLEIPVKDRHIIICSYYYREITQQLEQMGITDYKVYVQKVEWIVQTEQNKKE